MHYGDRLVTVRKGAAISVAGSWILIITLLTSVFSAIAAESNQPIDRHALVTRHNPIIRNVDVDAPLTVGNGGFAFTADITGLQTFAAHYHRWGVPLETLARWCWVSDPNPNNYQLSDANKDFKQADGRVVSYPTQASTPAGDWLRKNPRIHPLGQIGLDFTMADGSTLTPEDIHKPEQTLDLWRGVITSRYEIEGKPVEVTTVCHPAYDLVAVRIKSDLVAQGRLGAKLAFPRGHDVSIKNTPPLDWSKPEAHETKIGNQTPGWARLERKIGDTRHQVVVAWEPGVKFTEAMQHHYRIGHLSGSAGVPPASSSQANETETRRRDAGAPGSTLEFTIGFYPDRRSPHHCQPWT